MCSHAFLLRVDAFNIDSSIELQYTSTVLAFLYLQQISPNTSSSSLILTILREAHFVNGGSAGGRKENHFSEMWSVAEDPTNLFFRAIQRPRNPAREPLNLLHPGTCTRTSKVHHYHVSSLTKSIARFSLNNPRSEAGA